ncbi:aspartyl protease family protein [Dactylosporangium sp. NPDC051541]|uniref:aspartyl protease family protein n=1 Tax=Dactylosporangium sp. NPDC051541 TaxID=3363977 RepID=UPI0037A50FB4
MTDHKQMKRRGVLLGGAAIAGALWTAPAAASAAADPDVLFRDGRFAEADRGYAHRLRADPYDPHALAQRGYIALLHNRFADVQRFLGPIAGSDPLARRRLAESYVRQDRYDQAVPLMDGPLSRVYSNLGPHPWQVLGARRTRVPFLGLDPLPHVPVSLNGGPPRTMLIDTYATLTLSTPEAERLGLQVLATAEGVLGNHPVTISFGILGSLRLGDIELRNLPVQWVDTDLPTLPDGTPPTGVLGTTVLYHLLSTLDYTGGALLLRRKDEPAPYTTNPLPLWLAGDHFPCTLGTLGGYGPRIVTLDSGGIAHGLDTTAEIAERAGIKVDYAHPQQVNGVDVYPIRPDRMALGRVGARNIPGNAVAAVWPGLPGPGQSAMFGFDAMANFTHEYLKRFKVTFDYAAMRVSVS